MLSLLFTSLAFAVANPIQHSVNTVGGHGTVVTSKSIYHEATIHEREYESMLKMRNTDVKHRSEEERPPKILLIYRDILKPGTDVVFKTVEEDAALICAELHCPNSHLAIESITGTKQVWWLTPYESEADVEKIANGYASNPNLIAALMGISKRRKNLVEPGNDLFVKYRADLSRGAQWRLGGARFFVVTVTKGDPPVAGSVFEAPDGTRFILRTAHTRREADSLVVPAGSGAIIFAVRPYWGMPAREWIKADPEFWKANPTASRLL
jgi:hypothetical protein